MPKTRLDLSDPEQQHLLGHSQHTPEHTHTRGHLVHPVRGALSLVTPSGSWIAPSNRVVWIPAGHAHEHRAHGITDMRILFMPPPLAALLPAHPAVLVATPLAHEAIRRLTEGTRRDQGVRHRLRRVVIDEVTAAPEQPLHLPQPSDPRLVDLAALVQAHLADPSTLDDLGARIGASGRTLSRLFRDELGMGFRQWRTQLRVHHALLLLTEGRPVGRVAADCGWSNPSSFVDAFTALVGQTPGSYQRGLSAG